MDAKFKLAKIADKWHFELLDKGAVIHTSTPYRSQAAALAALEKLRARIMSAEVIVASNADGTVRVTNPLGAGATVIPPRRAPRIQTQRKWKAAAKAASKRPAGKAAKAKGS